MQLEKYGREKLNNLFGYAKKSTYFQPTEEGKKFTQAFRVFEESKKNGQNICDNNENKSGKSR